MAGSVEESAAKFKLSIIQMGDGFNTFAKVMKRLSLDKDLQTRELQESVRHNSFIYVNYVLPMSTKLVNDIKSLFNKYRYYSFEKWHQKIPFFIQKLKEYQSNCDGIIEFHEKMIVCLQNNVKKAIEVMKNLAYRSSIYQTQSDVYADSASSKRDLCKVLIFVPIVNLFACPMLIDSANTDINSANRCQGLANYLHTTAGFLNVLEGRLNGFMDEEDAEYHYNMMQDIGLDITRACEKYLFLQPMIKTTFSGFLTY